MGERGADAREDGGGAKGARFGHESLVRHGEIRDLE
jgi:hypothetical protein